MSIVRNHELHPKSLVIDLWKTYWAVLETEKVPLRLEKQFQGDVTMRVAVYDITLAKLIIHYIECLNKNSTPALIWLILGTAL